MVATTVSGWDTACCAYITTSPLSFCHLVQRNFVADLNAVKNWLAIDTKKEKIKEKEKLGKEGTDFGWSIRVII